MLPFHWQNSYANAYLLKGSRTPSVGPSSDPAPLAGTSTVGLSDVFTLEKEAQ